MKYLFTFILFIPFYLLAQETDQFNLNFEQRKTEDPLTDGWGKWGTHNVTLEEEAHSGKYAAKVSTGEDGSAFGSMYYRIPAKYEGKQIQLQGFMKIKDVSEGSFAGLLLRIDGVGGSLAFDNMQSKQINGTKDWARYSITLDYPEGAKVIIVAGIMVGKGEAWFDDFILTIDGQDVQTMKKTVRVYPAEKDKEFDGGSNINLSDLDGIQQQNLVILGKIWGLLKYHHPKIAKGELNWDYELFRILPDYVKIRNNSVRDKFLLNWINELGRVRSCKTCKPVAEHAFLKPDHEWISNSGFNQRLTKQLLYIQENRHQGEHYYIDAALNVLNPVFKNESNYGQMSYPDDAFRLLAVYRYWNMIHYYFPYKHLMDKDWNTTLPEYIPAIISAGNELEYEKVMTRMIGDIQDSHANLWGGADKLKEWKGGNYPAFHLRFVEDQLAVVDYYNEDLKSETGLEIGDVIVSVDGRGIDDIIKEKTPLYPSSNKDGLLRNMCNDFLRSKNKNITIEIKRNGKILEKEIPLFPRKELNKYNWYPKSEEASFRMLDGNIGYITLQTISELDLFTIKRKFKKAKGIVIDIRNYPKTFVPFSLGGMFVPYSSPFVKFTRMNPDLPGEFTFSQSLEISPLKVLYEGPVVILVNEYTQSQAEYTTMAFQAGVNTTVIGSTTSGADGNISDISLPGGLRTAISGIGVYYPDGKETQRVGVAIDVEMKPTIKGIKEGKDELLEKAIEIIKEQ